ncbi:MAG: hypothetical protein QNJ31_08070 [Candidatus Caenarcaniphilales bacterium]|nr:hypothetical protein [Candidatus Caenarcaniphilales bacterium]
MQEIKNNSYFFKRKQALDRERADVLLKNFYSYPLDRPFLDRVLSEAKVSGIDQSAAFQLVSNEDKTKLIVFFSKEVSKSTMKTKDEQGTRDILEVVRLTDKVRKRGNSLPYFLNYSFVCAKGNKTWKCKRGVQHIFKSKSLEIAKKAYFTNSLGESSFFKENTSDIDPSFWSRVGNFASKNN